ncbi:MAG: GMC family oxidoreductase N-terminal domain-containing protein [Actinobacteria bacterium]|nr:GMC family oxidoreductase N-terminal domain-containing protein [Actinomycetota bacterium]
MPERFDHVIVGAGSAGCVLARRLTDDPGTRVLLLEAGTGDLPRESRIPAANSKMFKTPVDWDYSTAPQSELDGRELYWPRGKMLGGSSSLNSNIYIRGNPLDYDGWAERGAKGWSWDDVEPYFIRSEDNGRGPVPGHGVDGPLPVSDPVDPHPLTDMFVAAGVEAGLPYNPDFNHGEQDGVGMYQVTIRRGRRASVYTSYLEPVLDRDNLMVVTDARVTRILLEGDRAVGVEFVRSGARHTARPTREVIISGGAINSPQLLLLSGIGPADELRDVGIELAHDLPGVGRNLQDHLAVGVYYETLKGRTLQDAGTVGDIARWLALGRGPLTSNIAEAGAFARTDLAEPAPDVQLHFGPVLYEQHGLVELEERGFSLGPCILRPRSRGRIALRSADPFDDALIEPNYLDDDHDLHVLVEGVKLCRRIIDASACEPWRGTELWPGEDVQSEGDLADFVRARAETLYHPAGTCAMGTDDDAVVDPTLRVHGLDGLRVVDASVMPDVVRGNTNVPTIMIAEKAADLILTGE